MIGIQSYDKKIKFTDIAKIVESVMSDVTQNDADNLETIFNDDGLARKRATEIIRNIKA